MRTINYVLLIAAAAAVTNVASGTTARATTATHSRCSLKGYGDVDNTYPGPSPSSFTTPNTNAFALTTSWQFVA